MRLTMRTRPRPIRLISYAVGAIVAGVLALALAIIVAAEWKFRNAQVPASEVLAPPNIVAPSQGGAAAPVLILLHGAGLNGRMWDPVRRGLDARYRVIALDLPGHGSRRDQVYTPETATAAIGAAARSVAPAPVILVGDSLGGYSAMVAAQTVPREQLRGLVIAGASSNRQQVQVLRYLRDVVQFTILFAFVDEPKFVSKALAVFGMSEADSQAIIAAGTSAHTVPIAARSLLYVDFIERLAAVDAPALIMNGSQDTRAIEQEASFVAVAKHGSSYRFENCQHGVSMRRSAEFARVVNEFAAHAFAPPSAELTKP